MKHVYVNSRLHSLTVGVPSLCSEPRDWIFSRGDKWLLLTPPRLRRLAVTLGLRDARITRLLDDVRRWHPHPEHFCRLLGLEAETQPNPNDYPPVPCPACDNIHYPHPGDADRLCPECAGKIAAQKRGARDRDELADARTRKRLLRETPWMFDEDKLAPNWRANKHRRLQRDWNDAVNRILLGGQYRTVAREFGCSVGALYRKVEEAKYWEWN